MATSTDRPRLAVLGTAAALGVLVAGLAVANGSRSAVVPGDWHLAFNLGIGAMAAAVALAAGLTARELGLARSDLGSGVRLGATAFGAVAVVVVAAGLAGALTDPRAQVSAGEMLWRALVLIPLGTVLVEELAFRGVLHGLLTRLLSPTRALVAGAVLFGLWHVFPAWRGGGVQTDLVEVNRTVTAAGTFLSTTVAGVGFVWLRARSQSLVAPILAHLATNSVTLAAAWAWG